MSTNRMRIRSRWLQAFGAVLATALLACAVEEAPSGGPEDREAPRVLGTIPARDSSGVDPGSAVAIEFSESMSRSRLERSVTFQPPIVIGDVSWKDNRMLIRAEGGFQPDTTYVVRVKPGYRDHHGVAGTDGYQFAFATGATLDTAHIDGSVLFKREPSARAVVWAFRLPRAVDFVPESGIPDREAATGRDGRFSLRNLPSNDARFLVLSFVDVNGNGYFERVSEPYAIHPDTVRLVPGASVVSGLNITVIDPAEPAVVRGRVSNETGIDSLQAMVALFASADSTRSYALVRCNEAGAYEFAKVRAGEYILRAFLDVRSDSVAASYPCPADTARGCPEPQVRLPGVLTVRPAATVEVPALILRKPEGP